MGLFSRHSKKRSVKRRVSKKTLTRNTLQKTGVKKIVSRVVNGKSVKSSHNIYDNNGKFFYKRNGRKIKVRPFKYN